eukprot:6450048-Alexandrium_andersonii.AAC.1
MKPHSADHAARGTAMPMSCACTQQRPLHGTPSSERMPWGSTPMRAESMNDPRDPRHFMPERAATFYMGNRLPPLPGSQRSILFRSNSLEPDMQNVKLERGSHTK